MAYYASPYLKRMVIQTSTMPGFGSSVAARNFSGFSPQMSKKKLVRIVLRETAVFAGGFYCGYVFSLYRRDRTVVVTSGNEKKEYRIK